MRKFAFIVVTLVLISQCLSSFAYADGFWQDLYDSIKGWGTSSAEGD
ncbi:MAG: hypothetical protein GF409_00330 [Candidatus Omnitrophica bacterium]|nr:hypothetical protein [Candidatus Omnitrophota bacterium]